MDYIEIETKMSNGCTVYVRVKYRNGKLMIWSVGIKHKRNRRITWLDDELSDDYVYRRLDFNERKKAEIKRYVDVVGVQVLNDSLRDAWLQIKPEAIEVTA